MACHDGWLYTLVVLTILSPALYSALTGFYERVVSGVPPRVGQVHPCVVFVCERPRLTLTMVYGVSLVLTLSAFVSACGDVLPQRLQPTFAPCRAGRLGHSKAAGCGQK